MALHLSRRAERGSRCVLGVGRTLRTRKVRVESGERKKWRAVGFAEKLGAVSGLWHAYSLPLDW